MEEAIKRKIDELKKSVFSVSILSLWKRPLKAFGNRLDLIRDDCFNPIIVEEAIKRNQRCECAVVYDGSFNPIIVEEAIKRQTAHPKMAYMACFNPIIVEEAIKSQVAENV